MSYDFTESLTIAVSPITYALEKADPQIEYGFFDLGHELEHAEGSAWQPIHM